MSLASLPVTVFCYYESMALVRDGQCYGKVKRMSKAIHRLSPADYWRIGENESWYADMASEGLHLNCMRTLQSNPIYWRRIFSKYSGYADINAVIESAARRIALISDRYR